MMGISHEPGWYADLRRSASERLETMSWPATTEEEWRRCDVLKLGLDSWLWESSAASVRVELSDDHRRAGIGFESLSEALASHADLLEPILARSLTSMDNRFVAWNFASPEAAYLLWIPPGVELEEPVFVDTLAGGRYAAPRLIVAVGAGSHVEVVHRTKDLAASAREAPGDTTSGLVNATLDLSLGDGASLGIYELQDLGPATLYFSNGVAAMGRDSSLRHFAAELGGSFVKSRMDCSLLGQGADARLEGAYLCASGRHMDLRTVQRHESPRATSRALYKGAIEGGGRTVFQGLIEVAEGAAGTDAFLTNRNLILGAGARSDSIPTLRIGNNDVRCSHGSTTGRLSEEELFYLESRGLDREEARELLVRGYFEDILTSTPQGFRDEALARIGTILARRADRDPVKGAKVA